MVVYWLSKTAASRVTCNRKLDFRPDWRPNFFGTVLSDCFAVLIDGGFARRALNKGKPPDSTQFHQLVEDIKADQSLKSFHLHRVYFYDTTPFEATVSKPLNGGPINFGQTPVASASKVLFDQLKKLPFFSLRMGETACNGWQLNDKALLKANGDELVVTKDDLTPKINQKGVDMRIGMDIAALTLKDHVKVIVLVTGDSGFVPAMKFARREGAQLFLCSFGRHLKPAMYEHSDLVLNIPT
jgi:uncharacterized LabA/DUF88 family protein